MKRKGIDGRFRRPPRVEPTGELLEQVKALETRPARIQDGSALPPGGGKAAVRSEFYKPVKQAVSLRLDADVIAWLKRDGRGYQTRVNRLLRERMLAELDWR